MSFGFYAAIFIMMMALFLLVLLPVIRLKKQPAESLTKANIAVVKQRLAELQREADEGLLSEQDMRQASDEIKISVVEEQQAESSGNAKAGIVLSVGALCAIGIAGWAYLNASNISRLNEAQSALEALPQLSEKLAKGQADSFTAEDFKQLTVAIRKRLQQQPDDGQGWMYLGRIWMALNQTDEAYAALEKAVQYAPGDSEVRMTYARALMASDDIGQLNNAKRLLGSLIKEQPDNDNLVLMLAVVAGRVGDAEVLANSLDKLKGKLPEDNPITIQLNERLASLIGNSNDTDSAEKTGFELTVDIADDLLAKLPGDGFLFVFAQDANTDNRMPAAVVRMALKDLPAKIVLTTDNAMTPNYSIKQLARVRLIARVSLDDQAPAVTGDLEGQIEADVDVGKLTTQRIVIDKEIQ